MYENEKKPCVCNVKLWMQIDREHHRAGELPLLNKERNKENGVHHYIEQLIFHTKCRRKRYYHAKCRQER